MPSHGLPKASKIMAYYFTFVQIQTSFYEGSITTQSNDPRCTKPKEIINNKATTCHHKLAMTYNLVPQNCAHLFIISQNWPNRGSYSLRTTKPKNSKPKSTTTHLLKFQKTLPQWTRSPMHHYLRSRVSSISRVGTRHLGYDVMGDIFIHYLVDPFVQPDPKLWPKFGPREIK